MSVEKVLRARRSGSGHLVPWRRRTPFRDSMGWGSRDFSTRAVRAFLGLTSRRRDIVVLWMGCEVMVLWCLRKRFHMVHDE